MLPKGKGVREKRDGTNGMVSWEVLGQRSKESVHRPRHVLSLKEFKKKFTMVLNQGI